MRSSQLRKTVNRNRNRNRNINKRKTWRNKRTKNARGGKLITSRTSDGTQEYEHDDETNDIFNVYQLMNGNNLPAFNGKMNENGDGHGKLYRYNSDGKMISMYEGFIKGKKKHGRGKYETYDLNGKLDSMYDGEWSDGKKNGVGEYQKRYTYSGEWKNDEKHGKGVESGPVWRGAEQIGTIMTEGIWVNNKAVNGTITIKNVDETKSVYVGELNGVNNRQGMGTYKVYDAEGKLLQDIYAVWDNNQVKTSLLRQPELTSQPSVLLQSTPTQDNPLKSTSYVPLLLPPPKARKATATTTATTITAATLT